MLKKRLRDQTQKDALEPLGGNDSDDSDDDVPVLLGGATRDGGKLNPGAATDTEEDIEITEGVLTEVKEWLNLDVRAFSVQNAT